MSSFKKSKYNQVNMKSIKFLAAFAATLLMAACSSDTAEVLEPTTPNEEQKTYEVRLNFEGEYVDVTEEPLTRAEEEAPKKLYGINVYCMKTDGSESFYSYYAYGVFDNKEDMVISLLGGYKYMFECTSVIEGEDKFPSNYFSKSGTFDYPFGSSLLYVRDINKFMISKSYYLGGLGSGLTTIGNTWWSYPAMDRYYGELENFDPATTSVATIPLKRTAFGIKLVVPAVPDGSLSVRYDINTYNAQKIITEPGEYATIYTFHHVKDCWKSEETYTESATLTFTWTRANGYQQTFTKDITVKRNVMTVLTVDLEGGASDVTLGLAEEQTEMGTENDEVHFNGGDLNDTPVNPEE